MGRPEGSIVHGPKALLSQLPSVDRLLQDAGSRTWVERHGATFVTQQARAVLADWRARLQAAAADGAAAAGPASPSKTQPKTETQTESASQTPLPDLQSLVAELGHRCQRVLAPRMRTVLNLSGTVIHTNLGRSVLPQAALDHIAAVMAGPNNLEYDLSTGRRGDRDSIVEALLCELTGAEAATVVNNNAAAVLLTLAALSSGRETLVSRGEQVEIGGAFRMPDVMASAGSRMVEVGTTNRTHLADYERAIGPETALLMKVHTSNYAVQGFTSSVSEAELAPLARTRGVWLATDLGSGALIDLLAWGLPKEPLPQDMIRAGCDVVTFSGDKLLGGPQAGLIVGRKAAIERIRKHPMKRALRVSKLPLAALEATLMLYRQPERLRQELPTLRWLSRPLQEIQTLAQTLQPAIQAALPHWTVEVVALQSQIGSGSLPVERMASAGLALAPRNAKGVGRQLEGLALALRRLPLPVIGRIENDRLLLDLRCLDRVNELVYQLSFLAEPHS